MVQLWFVIIVWIGVWRMKNRGEWVEQTSSSWRRVTRETELIVKIKQHFLRNEYVILPREKARPSSYFDNWSCKNMLRKYINGAGFKRNYKAKTSLESEYTYIIIRNMEEVVTSYIKRISLFKSILLSGHNINNVWTNKGWFVVRKTITIISVDQI